MTAAALTFREVLEVWLVVGVVLSFAGGGARQHAPALIAAIGASCLLGAAIGAVAGVYGASLDTKAKDIFQVSVMGFGALLLVWAVLTKPPYDRLERRLADLPEGSRVSVARVVFRTLLPITILTSTLLYGCAVGAWGAADLLGGDLGTAMGVVVGLLGVAAILSFARLEPRRWRLLVAVMVFVFFGYLAAYDAGALPHAGLIPSPRISPDRSVSSIMVVLGVVSIVLIVSFAVRRGQFRPRPFLDLINPLFIGVAAYFVTNGFGQLDLWHVIKFPEEASAGVLVVAMVLLGVAFLRSNAVLPPLESVHPLAAVEQLTRLQRLRLRWALARGRGPTPRPGEERAGG
jgi:hypothetical protein